MNKMGVYNPGPKKKNMKVIALAVICIVLAAGLVGVTAVYLANGNSADLKAQITAKDKTISALQANNETQQNTLQSQSDQIASLQNQVSSLNTQLLDLNDTVSGYYNIALMQASDVLFSQQPITQDANATTEAFNNAIYYAGYVAIQATATSNTTFVAVSYAYAGTNFNYNQTIGTSGSAVFPVLPSELIINIGNIDHTEANNITASATYYY
jgi:flagellar basal body-associated protein FliL